MKSKKDTPLICSFCGKQQGEHVHLIAGQTGYICDQCVYICKQVIDTKLEPQLKAPAIGKNLLTPKEIKSKLDEYVIGQEDVKKILSVAVYTHYKRINHNFSKQVNEVELDKSNILLLGPTGTGKTLLASTLAKIVNVPFAIADATTLTEAGYVGDDVENILLRLIQNADFNIESAERGIIFIDELDKISRKSENTSITRDVSGEGVQQALLKIIEGTIASVPAKGGRKHPQSSNINIDTKNILFICGGAFVELEQIIKNRINQNQIGFKSEQEKHSDLKEVHSLTNPDDLVKFGLIPELIGRLPILAALSQLTDSELREVLLTPKNSIIKQYKVLFKMEGIDLELTEDAIDGIVENAKELKTGARGLRSSMEKVFFQIMYDIPGSNIKKITLTKEILIKYFQAQNHKKSIA